MINQEGAARGTPRWILNHGDSVNYKPVHQLAVGDYLEVTVDIGGQVAAVMTLGVVAQTRSSNRSGDANMIQMVLRNVGPIWLLMSGTFALVPEDSMTPFCAHCYLDETEHVGDRCLYSFFRYRSIKEVY